ncbi:3-oxoadipate enol-lactonase [Alsobacter sp. R-9]
MTTLVPGHGGTGIACTVSGAEGAPWIVLSHSLGATSSMWDPQMPLLERHFRVLRYDTRGHGASEAPPGAYCFGDLTGDVIAVMDRFDIRHATFMGLSLGGMTALGLALAHPGRFERIVCCDARADAPPAFQASWVERLAAVDAGGLAAIVEGTMERWFAADWRSANPAMLQRFRDEFVATPVAGYRGCVGAIRTLDYLRSLGSIRIPTLYVCGSEDAGAPVGTMKAMAVATPGARLEVIEGGAHLPNVDRTDSFNRAVAGFLGIPA